MYAGPGRDWPVYGRALAADLERLGVDAHVARRFGDPAEVDYIVYSPDGPVQDFAPFASLKAVLSLWAGVERVLGNPTLKAPLARMVDSGLREGMVEWVAGHVLRHHLGMDSHVLGQDGVWRAGAPAPLARERSVGILGLGELGRACAEALLALNFRVVGWSRSPREIPGADCFSGPGSLDAVLPRSEILVLLLPNTPETENVIGARAIGLLPPGAVIINPGRGSLIDDEALLGAVRSGKVAHATLDVFRDEPLPPSHPFWREPGITVTPHIAAATRPSSASRAIAENIARAEAGRPLLNLVDRGLGY